MCIFYIISAKSKVKYFLKKQNLSPCANVQNHKGIPLSAAKLQFPITPQASIKSLVAIAYNYLVRKRVKASSI